MTVLEKIEAIAGFTVIVASFAGLIFYLGEMKATISRNQRRAERLEKDIEELLAKDKDLQGTIFFSGAAANNNQIRLNHIEAFLEDRLEFKPISTHTDFDRRNNRYES